ncbi:MAG: hypothetical protein J0L93_07690 [Deltaproteobacteria bacterium]|nr:hypothetical protein [Deltaproteobacteria bacterium]
MTTGASKTKILIADEIAPEALQVFERQKENLEIEILPGLDSKKLKEKIFDKDALLVRMTAVNESLLAAGKNLKIVGRIGNGVDNIDLKAAEKRGIKIMNSPTASANSTAEHTIALLLAALRKIPEAHRSLRVGKWERNFYKGTEVAGKTFGIIGLGRIGSRVALRMKAFECEVIACDPYLAPERAASLKVPLVSFEELLSRSDFVSIHTPLNESTRYLLNAKNMPFMKNSSVLVNAARGGLVEERGILPALQSKKLLAYATDVFETEPPDSKNYLLHHPQVICTPHLGAQTQEAQIRVSVAMAEQLIHFFETGEVLNAVDSQTEGKNL